MKKLLLYINIIILIIGFGNYACSQQKVNVITKTIKKDLDYTNEKLIIRGEKSNISICKSDGDKLKIQIDLIAKNPSKSKAEKDLDILQYSISQTGDTIELTNFFRSDRIVDISSNLSVEYYIYIPSECNIDIKNIYGKINAANVNISGKIDNSFGNVSLNNISGNLEVGLYYSNLLSSSTHGQLKITAKNSDLSMEKLSGNNLINTTYGEIYIESLQRLKELNISAQRSSVNVTIDKFENYNYELEAFKDKVVLPAQYRQMVLKKSGSNLFKQSYNPNNKSIKIKSTYCPITIKSN